MYEIPLRGRGAKALKSSLRDGLPNQFYPLVDRIVGCTRFSLTTLRILSAFFDDMRPSPECPPEKIMRWKRDTIDFFNFFQQKWARLRTDALLAPLKDYAKHVGLEDYAEQVSKGDRESQLQLLLLAASIEAAIPKEKARSDP